MLDHGAACSVSSNVALLLLALPIGVLIGLMGVGGILLVPLLASLGGCSEHQAVALSLASFIGLGILSAIMRVRGGAPPSRGELLLYALMIPGAVLGAILGGYLSDAALLVTVALAVAFTGVWTLMPRPRVEPRAALPGSAALAAVGIGSGALCALTGAGGPVVVMPLLLVQGVAVREALAISQVAQFPIAVTATLMRGLAGGIGIGSMVALGACLTVGLLGGLRLGRIVPAHGLQRIVGWALVIAGLAMLGMLALHHAR